MSKGRPNYDMYKRSTEPSLFPSVSYVDAGDSHEHHTDFNQFKILKPSFLNVAHMITAIYAESTRLTCAYLTTNISFDDLCDTSDFNNASNNTSFDDHLVKPITEHKFRETRPACTIPTPIRNIFQEVLPQCFR